MTRKWTVVAMFCVSLVAALVAQNRPSNSNKKPDTPATEDTSYIIGPDDVLNVNVWKEPEVSGGVPVRPDGKISLPLLNDVQAAGLTPIELSMSIAEKLKKYLEEPRVTVVVTAINSRRVYILGQVARPGVFALFPGMTVLQALSTAGGLGEFAHGKDIYVLRTEAGKQQRLAFNYHTVLKGQNSAQNICLKPGDTIVVP